MKFKKIISISIITFCVLTILGLVAYTNSNYYLDLDEEGCTSIMVGKDISVDGSVITSHTCGGRSP